MLKRVAMKTKQDLVLERYGNQTVDYALPLQWVQECNKRGFDVVPHFVWLYDTTFGRPASLTPEGDVILSRMAH